MSATFVTCLFRVGNIVSCVNHEHHGKKLLSELGFDKKWADIVGYHGNTPYEVAKDLGIDVMDIRPEQILLWEANLHIDREGNFLTFEERIADIKSRHQKIIDDLTANDPHVPLTITEDGRVTDIGYHLSYVNDNKAEITAKFIEEYSHNKGQ